MQEILIGRAQNRKVQQKIFFLGLVFAANTFFEHIGSTAEWSLQAQSIINFPLIVVGGVLLFQFSSIFNKDTQIFLSISSI